MEQPINNNMEITKHPCIYVTSPQKFKTIMTKGKYINWINLQNPKPNILDKPKEMSHEIKIKILKITIHL